MKLMTLTLLSSLAIPTAPLLAQDSTLPESMRIQQSVTQQNGNTSTNSANGGSSQPTTEAPGTSGGPVETNRLDPAAPSSQRLQIDDGASAAVRQNPDANALHPGSQGTSYNTIVRGSPSTSGTSTGTGAGTTGVGSSGAGSAGGSMGSSGGGSAGGAGGGH